MNHRTATLTEKLANYRVSAICLALCAGLFNHLCGVEPLWGHGRIGGDCVVGR